MHVPPTQTGVAEGHARALVQDAAARAAVRAGQARGPRSSRRAAAPVPTGVGLAACPGVPLAAGVARALTGGRGRHVGGGVLRGGVRSGGLRMDTAHTGVHRPTRARGAPRREGAPGPPRPSCAARRVGRRRVRGRRRALRPTAVRVGAAGRGNQTDCEGCRQATDRLHGSGLDGANVPELSARPALPCERRTSPGRGWAKVRLGVLPSRGYDGDGQVGVRQPRSRPAPILQACPGPPR